MEDSVFTKIIKGEIPAEKVYEDDKALVFLDIHPIQPGHMLVIPKQQVNHFDDLDDETYTHLFLLVKKAAKKLKEVFEPVRVCVRVEGFDVPHAHIHVYPCNNADEFYGDRSRMLKEPDHEALGAMAQRLKLG